MTAQFNERRLTLAAQALGISYRGPEVRYQRVCTDTRQVQAGDLFVALTGPNFDGNAFLEQAFAAGAVAAMGSRVCGDKPVLIVDDGRRALGQLAHQWRLAYRHPLIAITGSNGKTTVKEMTRAIASQRGKAHATRGNLNNDIGMPLTLLELDNSHEFAVIEMGANHPGEIAYLAELAVPDVGLVNNAGSAHMEGFRTPEGVARAKGEMFVNLKSNATAVINADDKYASLWNEMAQHCKQLRFGISAHDADVRATEITETSNGTRFTIEYRNERALVNLSLFGRHNVMNALAASAATLAVGITLAEIALGLESLQPVHGRLETRQCINGSRLIDDTYNANPDSARAAIDVLAGFGGTRVLVLGDMFELGENSAQDHYGIGEYARSKGIDSLYATGALSKNAVRAFGTNGFHFGDTRSLVDALAPKLDTHHTVLVKGSRGMRMEQAVEGLSQTKVSGVES